MKVHLISLGCPRNLVDTEIMIGRLLEAGHTVLSDESEADCVVVNTCSFIEPAVNESIDVILETAAWKQASEKRRLVVCGCLPQRYGMALVKDLQEVDVFLGTGAFDRIVPAVEGALKGQRVLLPPPAESPVPGSASPRFQTTPRHTAYLKIAEGCSGRCTYCIIPKLRGPQRSRSMEDVLAEARFLGDSGVKELVLIAQNTMAYGRDLGLRHGLGHLLEALSPVSGLAWIRVLYGHPDYLTDDLIKVMASASVICSYFDVPIQHISEPILKKMGRSPDSGAILDRFERIRTLAPDAALRTTVMVGFPGESNHDFQCLMDLIERVRFDHLGAFIYSDEKDLPSSGLTQHVPGPVKKERFHRLMSLQREISRENNQKYVDKTLRVLVENAGTSGRTSFQGPEIDGVVYIRDGSAEPGTFADVNITEAGEYDLGGVIV